MAAFFPTSAGFTVCLRPVLQVYLCQTSSRRVGQRPLTGAWGARSRGGAPRLTCVPLPAGRSLRLLPVPGRAAGARAVARRDEALLRPALPAALLLPAERAQHGHAEGAREPAVRCVRPRPARGPGRVPLRTLLSFKKLTPVEEVESSRGWQEAEQNDNKVSEKSTRLVCAVWGGTAEPLGDGASSQAPSKGRAARAACALPGGRGTNGAGAACLALYFSSPV